jgi:uncharacterized protein YcfL
MKILLLVSLILFTLTGCAATKLAHNASDDLSLLIDQLHLDVQQAIQHPERWEAAINYLCDEAHMLRADQCIQAKALIRVKMILTTP